MIEPENLLELRVLALEKEIAFINTILHSNAYFGIYQRIKELEERLDKIKNQ